MDQIEKIGNSVLQHGKFNDRIYLLKYNETGNSDLLFRIDELALKRGYTKIIAKIPASAQAVFLMNGYMQEACIPSFFDGKEDAFFMAKYIDSSRSVINNESLSVFARLFSVPANSKKETRPAKFDFRIADKSNIEEMAEVYRQVFETYPFPITNAAYLESTMDEGSVVYFGVWDREKLVGLSSSEMDIKNRNAEMTDFAVLPEYQGQKLALFLLEMMENEMKMKQFKTLYTIARLESPGMNRTFINCGYRYSGLLKNNTNISGQIESMNVYYKNI